MARAGRTVNTPRPHPYRHHLLAELGFTSRLVDDELHATGAITPPMHVPGTSRLRISILACWADMVGGMLTMRAIAPRAPVTLELDVHLYRPRRPGGGCARSAGSPRPGARSP